MMFIFIHDLSRTKTSESLFHTRKLPTSLKTRLVIVAVMKPVACRGRWLSVLFLRKAELKVEGGGR